MKAVRIKREHYGVIKEMTDRQAGEFVKSGTRACRVAAEQPQRKKGRGEARGKTARETACRAGLCARERVGGSAECGERGRG